MHKPEIRKLGLREKILEAELKGAEQRVQSMSGSLRQVKAKTLVLENSWKQELKKAVSQQRSDPSPEQRFGLRLKLHQIGKLRKIMQSHKDLEQQKITDLQKGLSLVKNKERQLEACICRKKQLMTAEQEMKEQSELEEVVSRPAFVNSISSPLNKPSSRISGVQAGQSLRWVDADLKRQIIESNNGRLKINVSHSSSGMHLSLDYLHKPGHLISLHAQQQKSLISVKIRANNQADREALLDETGLSQDLPMVRIRVL